jgi:hypothetical protein
MVYRVYCIWENKRRDKTGTAEAFDHAYEDDLTDRKVRLDSDRVSKFRMLMKYRTRSSDTSIEFRRYFSSCTSTERRCERMLILQERLCY